MPRGPLAAVHAVLREAIVSSSPFYRLLLAFRAYEGLQIIRRKINEARTTIELRSGFRRALLLTQASSEG